MYAGFSFLRILFVRPLSNKKLSHRQSERSRKTRTKNYTEKKTRRCNLSEKLIYKSYEELPQGDLTMGWM